MNASEQQENLFSNDSAFQRWLAKVLNKINNVNFSCEMVASDSYRAIRLVGVTASLDDGANINCCFSVRFTYILSQF